MRKRKLASILFGVMLICFGLGTLIAYIENPGWNWNPLKGKYNVSIDDTKTYDVKDIDEISIDIPSEDLKIIPDDREDLKAVFSGTISSSSEITKPELKIDKSSGKLLISISEMRSFFGYLNTNLKLDVYIPKNYSKNLSLETASGDVTIEPLTLNNLKCSLSSGDLIIKEVNCSKFDYNCSSGDLKADTLNVKETKLNSSSGDITINSLTGSVEGTSSSGDVKIGYKQLNGDVHLRAHSGDLKLILPQDSEFHVDANCTSGDVECTFPITISGKKKDNSLIGTVKSDRNKLELSTSSGDITITSN